MRKSSSITSVSPYCYKFATVSPFERSRSEFRRGRSAWADIYRLYRSSEVSNNRHPDRDVQEHIAHSIRAGKMRFTRFSAIVRRFEPARNRNSQIHKNSVRSFSDNVPRGWMGKEEFYNWSTFKLLNCSVSRMRTMQAARARMAASLAELQSAQHLDIRAVQSDERVTR
jgi:hypothetical protein